MNAIAAKTQAVVIAINRTDGEDDTVYGPFPSGDDASRWGFNNFRNHSDWYWLPLTAPLKPQA